MMRRILASLIALAWLVITADAAGLVSSHRLAAIGGTRPTLVAATGGFDSTSTSSRTVSVTPPVGTSLLVAYVSGMRSGGTSGFELTTLTFGGTALAQLTSFDSFNDNRIVDGIAYRLNPTTGVAQNLTFTTAFNWESSIIYVWMFSGTDPSDPFGNVHTVEEISVQEVDTEFAPEYGRPYIVAGSSAKRGSGAGTCYTATNLTIVEPQSAESDQDNAGIAAANATLTGAGITRFAARCSYGASGATTLEVVEVKGP